MAKRKKLVLVYHMPESRNLCWYASKSIFVLKKKNNNVFKILRESEVKTILKEIFEHTIQLQNIESVVFLVTTHVWQISSS